MPWRRRKRTIVMRLEKKITMPIAINRPIGIRTIPQIIAVPRTSAYLDTWNGYERGVNACSSDSVLVFLGEKLGCQFGRGAASVLSSRETRKNATTMPIAWMMNTLRPPSKNITILMSPNHLPNHPLTSLKSKLMTSPPFAPHAASLVAGDAIRSSTGAKGSARRRARALMSTNAVSFPAHCQQNRKATRRSAPASDHRHKNKPRAVHPPGVL